MQQPEETAEPAVADESPAAAVPHADASFATLARDTAEYARAWGSLAASEAALAKINLVRLLVLALIVPALALGVVLGIDALLAALAFRLLQNWGLAIASVVLVDLGLLLGVFALLRQWWRSLSLPRSRAELSRLMQGLQ